MSDRHRDDVKMLTESTARRKRLLAEAYPMLKTATDGGIPTVKFANWDFALAEFQREVDDLLSQQQRETALLGIKRASLERLTKNTESGEQVLSEMHPALAVANKRQWNRRRWTWSAQSPRAKTALVEPSTRA